MIERYDRLLREFKIAMKPNTVSRNSDRQPFQKLLADFGVISARAAGEEKVISWDRRAPARLDDIRPSWCSAVPMSVAKGQLLPYSIRKAPIVQVWPQANNVTFFKK